MHNNIFNQPFLTRELKGTEKQKAKRMLILITLLSLTVAVAAVAYAVMLRRRYRENEQPAPTPYPVAEDDDITRKVDEWMWTTLSVPCDNSITLDSMAEGTGIQRSVLQDYLQNRQCLTFKAWISTIRINHCKELLDTTDYTLSEISYMCGYADLPSMSKAFKRRFGMSPSAYKKRLEADVVNGSDK